VLELVRALVELDVRLAVRVGVGVNDGLNPGTRSPGAKMERPFSFGMWKRPLPTPVPQYFISTGVMFVRYNSVMTTFRSSCGNEFSIQVRVNDTVSGVVAFS